MGAYDAAPYRGVLTHGFIVDGDGRKMSKSLGNVVSPLDVVAKSGADIVRLWAASADYSQDVSVSDEILDRTSEAYRRIRNTFRFLLSNLYDYDPAAAVAFEDMPEFDRWAMVTLADLVDDVTRQYDEWQFHRAYRSVYDYCVTTLSAFYLDALKDRLYADAATSLGRRSAQTVLAAMLTALVRLVAPVLTFTSEEVWQEMPAPLRGGVESVQLAGWAAVDVPEECCEDLREAYAVVLAARDVVTRALEEERAAGRIGKSQEAHLTIAAPAEDLAVLSARGAEALAEMLIVADVAVEEGVGAGMTAAVTRAAGDKCPRCWNVRHLGSDGLCPRCSGVVTALGGAG